MDDEVLHLHSVPDTGREARQPIRSHHGGGTLRSRAFTLGVRLTVRPVISAWSLTPRLPWPYFLADQTGRLLRRVAGTSLEVVQLPECEAHVVRNEEVDTGRVVLYFQGGAFLVGGVHLHGQLVSRIAQLTGATVVVPRFRKLPRHPVRAAVSDGLDAYRYVLDRGVEPEDVVFAGDSAGGFLTFMVALAAREAGLPMPASIVAMSPLVDLDPTSRSTSPRGCALFTPRAFRTLLAMVERAHRRGGDPDPATLSPCGAELPGLPPTLIQVSSAESLYCDADRMATLLASAGVDCELQVWDHQVHVFQAAAGIISEAREALENVAAFMDRTAPGSYARDVGSAVDVG